MSDFEDALEAENKELQDEIKDMRAEIERLKAALRAMHEEFASNFPDGERAAVDAARAALEGK